MYETGRDQQTIHCFVSCLGDAAAAWVCESFAPGKAYILADDAVAIEAAVATLLEMPARGIGCVGTVWFEPGLGYPSRSGRLARRNVRRLAIKDLYVTIYSG
eukprot:scaffold7349_cov173-Amphora_coffeaeformis.AAC.75